MKKIILFLMLIGAFSQAKAQQLLSLTKPDLKLSDGLQNSFRPDAYPSPKLLLIQPEVKSKQLLTANNGIIVYSKMPVLKPVVTDKMPIAVSGQLFAYTMLIKKVIVPNEPLAKSLMP